MTATVAVVGGGYGGITAAKELDDAADVVLIEPRDTFVHNVAALRGLVDPEWAERLFLPYDRLLRRGRVVRGRAVQVDPAGVTLGSGERVGADFVVLATGSGYPFPAKFDIGDDSAAAKAKIRTAHDALRSAESVLLLGAGPVGLELAGEIAAMWPDKPVTIVDPFPDIVSGGFPDEFRAELRRQLDELGVELVLGTSLRDEPVSEPGEIKSFTVTTTDGREVSADIWFRCYGVVPTTGYLAGELTSAREPRGHLAVTPQLRLPGHDHVFAIGDITAIPETKMAKVAEIHARTVAANIRAIVDGTGELSSYEPAPPGISLPLGPTGGASYASHVGVVDAATTAQLKGNDLRIGSYLELLGLQ